MPLATRVALHAEPILNMSLDAWRHLYPTYDRGIMIHQQRNFNMPPSCKESSSLSVIMPQRTWGYWTKAIYVDCKVQQVDFLFTKGQSLILQFALLIPQKKIYSVNLATIIVNRVCGLLKQLLSACNYFIRNLWHPCVILYLFYLIQNDTN